MTEERPAIPQAMLITGSAVRIGRTIAEAMAADGWAIAVHHQNSGEEAEDLVATVNAAGGRAVALHADLSNETQTGDLLPRATEALGPIGCLINNASTFEYDDLAGVTRSSWDFHMEVNLRAPFVLSQAFAAALPAGDAGAIINVIDQRVWNLTPHFVSYTLSKAGLWTLTQTLALALAPHIRVNAIGPGPVLPSVRQTRKEFEAQCRRTPLGHGASAAEIADAVRFILAAPALTGQMLALDGGQHMGWVTPEITEPKE